MERRIICACRYYADTGAAGARGGAAGAEFTQLTPGQLSDETRAALGIGPLDPPPWLDKMRELGYPPMHRYQVAVYCNPFYPLAQQIILAAK